MMPPVKEPLAGLALLVIFGFLIWHNRPLERSRPFYPDVEHQNPNTTGHAYESRFWEDPFAFDPPEPKEEKSKGYCKEQLIEEIKATENPVKILAPLLKVRPETLENRELRTRHRYAVIAGLIESGYRPLKPGYRPLARGHHPLEAGHLHFCSSQENSSKHEYDVRWEHYSRESQDELGLGKSDVIVVWMNSEIFIDDNRFGVILKNLLGEKKIIKDSFYIYDLNNILDQKRSAWITEKINRINDENCKNKGIELGGIQTEDKALTNKLAKELELRNIKEPSEEVMIITEYDSENARNLSRSFSESLHESFCKDQPAKSSTEARSTSTHNNSESGTCEIRNVFYLKGLDAYQQIIHKQDKNENQAADKEADRRPIIDLHNSPPLPIGPNQLDYFHRLAGQIKAPHHDIDLKKRDSGIKAVGIFGTDFHDKLLILEALRAEMPHILVFTTDLDAQMLHRRHWRSIRNLVVASHFDLLLREETKDDKNRDDKNEDEKTRFWQHQDQFPPFRDSQQTNIFYRILSIAAGDAKGIEESEKTFPRIFEVGRNGFVSLGTAEKNNSLDYHPRNNTQENTAEQLTLLALIAASLIGFHWAIRPWSDRFTAFLFLFTSLMFAIAFGFGTDFFSTNESREPLSFTDGVSLWPTLFIQILAVFLAGVFFVQTIGELEGNFCRLNVRYFRNRLSHLRVRSNRCESLVRSRLHSLGLWLRGLRREWRLFVVLTVSVAVYAWNDVDPSGFSFWPCFTILAVLATVYLIVIEKIEKLKNNISIKHWMEADSWSSPSSQVNHERELWKQYKKYGRFGPRIVRVVGIWLIFAIIETLLAYLLPPWPLPGRGPTATDWISWFEMARVTGVLGFTVIMLLLFFILDAVRLNFYWIKKLRTQHPLLTVQSPDIAGLPSLKDMVPLVAERTRAVDKLIYYPMLCIMLMLFAQITYFDNQEFPLSKGITFGAAISLLFFSGFVLRHEANELRLCVKKSVRVICVNNCLNNSLENETISRIDAIDEGAYQPMLEQPVMQALLMILASIGLFAGEYLKLLG
ncbi:MFS transporter [Nitrosospira briensis]|uniref:MFS transporter n=1 Tax=Nitrosospira briensis TaxID=35799 RepID=UPI0011609162|nr:MFS transporter [Nitrosospira briensis]